VDEPAAGSAGNSHRRRPAVRLLVLSGGDHPYEVTTPIIVDFCQAAGHEVTVTEDAGVLAGEGMSAYDVLVFNTLRQDDTNLTRAEQSGMTRFISGGKGFVCIHAATWLTQEWPEYHDVTGGGWDVERSWHAPYGQISVVVADPDHPAAGDMADFVTSDELYIKIGWREGNEVLLTADFEGEARPMAWTRTYGGGRVFTTTLGHDAASIQPPQYRRMVLNGVRWAGGDSQD
jgi:type 1 glutamine amidotransferase